MKITTGNFGNVLPAQTQPRDVGRGTGHIIAEGLGQVANSIGNIEERGRRQIEQQEVQQKVAINYEYEQQDRLAKMQAENDYSTAMLDLHNATAQIKQDVLNGNKNSVDADAEIQKLSDDRWTELERTVPIQHMPEFKTRYQGQVNGQRATLVPAQIQANQNNEFVLIDQAMSINSRNPDRVAGAQGFAKVLQNSNIPDAKKSELAYAFVGQQDRTELNGRLLGVREAQDLTAVDTLLTDLEKPEKWRGLDAQVIDAYKAQAIGLKTQIQNGMQLQAEKQVKVAETTTNKFFSNILTGELIAPEELQRVQSTVQGTPYAEVVQNHIKNYAAIQRFKELPIPQQEAELVQMEAIWAKTPTSNPEMIKDLRGAYQKAMQDKRQTATNNPIEYVAKQGLYQPEPINALAILTPEGSKQVAGIVADRVQTLMAAQQKDPSIGLNPLQESELQGVKQVFGQMDNEQKLQFFGQMIGELKHVPRGGEAYGRFVGQVAGKDTLLRMAAVAEFAGLKGDQGTRLSAAILDGQSVIREKTTILPNDDQLQQQFNDYVGNAISGQSKADAFEVFKALHASYAKSRNRQYESGKDKPDKYLVDTALNMATGGIYTQDVRYSGVAGQTQKEWKVIKPYGMTDENFELRMNAGLDAMAKKYGTTKDELDNYRLRQRPGNDRQYTLIGENGRDLILNGKPVILDLGK